MNPFLQPSALGGCESKLINAIYDAATRSDLWPRVLDGIRKFCGTDQCTIFFYDGIEQHRNYAAAARLKIQTLDLYLDQFITSQAEQLNNQLRCLPTGKVVTDIDIFQLSGNSYAQIVGEKYMQSLWPKLQFQAGVVLFRSENSCAGLALQNMEDTRSIDGYMIERLQRLTPHLIQATHIRQRINQLEKANNAFEAVLKYIRLGVILLDENYRLTFINPEAMRAFSKCANIQYKLHQKFQLADAVQNASALSISTEKYQKRKIVATETSIKVDYPNGHLKLNLFAINSNQYIPIPNKTEIAGNARYLVLIQDSCRPCTLPTQYLKQAYGITPAEGELVTHLVNGASLVEAAEMREITHETARWQMKNIMQKTGAHTQTELALLMLSL